MEHAGEANIQRQNAGASLREGKKGQQNVKRSEHSGTERGGVIARRKKGQQNVKRSEHSAVPFSDEARPNGFSRAGN